MEFPRLGVESELPPLAYTTTVQRGIWATSATYHSSGQHRILNPLSEARERTGSSWFLVGFVNCSATAGNSWTGFCAEADPLFFSPAGKGEHGKPYPLTEEDHDDSAYRENGFNIFVSNNIALERSLPDIRHAKWVPARLRGEWFFFFFVSFGSVCLMFITVRYIIENRALIILLKTFIFHNLRCF